jgi:hypothetical protein
MPPTFELILGGKFEPSNFDPDGQIKSREFTILQTVPLRMRLVENSPCDWGRGIILAAKGVLADGIL